jgi:hypothetical protein
MKKISALIGVTLCVQLYAQELVTTVSFDANVSQNEIPNAELASAFDGTSTHIVWLKDQTDGKSVMYSKYTPPNTIETFEAVAKVANETRSAPNIVLDGNGKPHICYIIKRDKNKGTKSGNFAVMYAGDDDGNGVFDLSQVSSNVNNPDLDPNNVHDCFVNGRPNITTEGTTILVAYLSSLNALNSFNNEIIFARKSGATWNRTVEHRPNPKPSSSSDISLPTPMSTPQRFIWEDIGSNYRVWLATKSSSWSAEILQSHTNYVRHSQLIYDNNNNIYAVWYRSDTKKFCFKNITQNGNVVEVTPDKTPGGNLFPSAIDATTGEKYFLYNQSVGGDAYIIKVDNQNNKTEIRIADPGVVYGKNCMHVKGGKISIVSASDSRNKIYITRDSISSQPTSLNKALKSPNIIYVYPNPATSQIEIKGLSGIGFIKDVFGKTVLTLNSNGTYSIQDLSAGVYFIFSEQTPLKWIKQ